MQAFREQAGSQACHAHASSTGLGFYPFLAFLPTPERYFSWQRCHLKMPRASCLPPRAPAGGWCSAPLLYSSSSSHNHQPHLQGGVRKKNRAIKTGRRQVMKEIILEMDSTFPLQLIWDVSGFRDHPEDQRCCSALPWHGQSSPSSQQEPSWPQCCPQGCS